MNKETIIVICQAIIAGLSGAAAAESTPSGDAPTGRGRGRPPKEKEVPAATVEELRDYYAKLVEDGQGDAVKKVITKYSSTGIKDFPVDDAAKVAAFKRDIDALSNGI